MELKGDLQVLIERAWALHHEIKLTTVCAFCCYTSDKSFQENQSLIAIGDSLKDVGDVLIFLQRLRCRQLIDGQAALSRLEESRVVLTERLKEYKGRSSIDIIKDLNSSFSHGNTVFDWNLSGSIIKKNDANYSEKKKRKNGFMIRMLFDPWKWRNAFVVAAKLIVFSVGISSTVRLCGASSSRVEARIDHISLLDVYNGRG
ncbi:uncharacterized protein LOC126688320 [Mercurialis annua]|uniref:uncharacterized protein LOC126688320 n=1 Tax=Mercurialis annua TaxID=3986 RepID=UPI0021603FF0|nr:uncharacterized protein LOC126688320 [Mercurialis annua]